MPDPLAAARRLLALVELIYLARSSAALHGVIPAAAAARQLVPLGRRLRDAIAHAEAAAEGSPERAAALAEVVSVGEVVAMQVDEAWEGITGLVSGACGVRWMRDRGRRRGWGSRALPLIHERAAPGTRERDPARVSDGRGAGLSGRRERDP